MCERTEEKNPLWLRGLVGVGTIVVVFIFCAIGFFFGQISMEPELVQLSAAQNLVIKKNAEIEVLKAAKSQADEKNWNQRHDERLAINFIIERIRAEPSAAEQVFGDVTFYNGVSVTFDDGENQVFSYVKMIDEFPDAPWVFESATITADNDH